MVWDVEVLTTWRRPGDPHVAARFAGPRSHKRALDCLEAELDAIREDGGDPVVTCRRWVDEGGGVPEDRRDAGVALCIEVLREPVTVDQPAP